MLPNRPVRVRIADLMFLMAPKGTEAKNIWSGSRFESHAIAFILQMLRADMVFLDIGANVGIFSLATAKKYPAAKIYAFEPCMWTFQVLQQNIYLNAINNVKPFRTAVADYSGAATLQVNAPGLDGLNTLGKPSHVGNRVVAQESVPITTLDEFIAEQGVSQVDIIKVDVAGAELFVFQGARDLLRRADAPLILYDSYRGCTKGFNYHPAEIMWFLQDDGYSLFVLDNQTGQLIRRRPEHGYDAQIVAAKPQHPYFGTLTLDVI